MKVIAVDIEVVIQAYRLKNTDRISRKYMNIPRLILYIEIVQGVYIINAHNLFMHHAFDVQIDEKHL